MATGFLRAADPEVGVRPASPATSFREGFQTLSLKTLYKALTRIPVVGRLVRIAAAVYRLPELRAYEPLLTAQTQETARKAQALAIRVESLRGAQQESTGRVSELESRIAPLEALPSLEARVAELSQRQQVFENEHLPSLLRTVSTINHRQVVADADTENLVRSVPVALRRLTRVQHDLEQRVAALDGVAKQLADAQSAASALARGLESGIAAMRASQEGTGGDASELRRRADDLGATVAYLLGRVEFVRRELMFELRYGAGRGEQGLETTARVVNPDKVASARSATVRLNLGCGHIPLDGYLNVDRRELPGVDVVAEVDQLPFGKGEVDELHSAHLLEHFPEEQLRRQVLPYWFGLLKPGGRFRAVVPDAEAMIREYSTGRYPYEDLREVTFGGQDYDGDFHFNMFTPASMSRLLTESGFEAVELVASGRRNGSCYEFEVCATKPAAVSGSVRDEKAAIRVS
jgi:hypothetical protein